MDTAVLAAECGSGWRMGFGLVSFSSAKDTWVSLTETNVNAPSRNCKRARLFFAATPEGQSQPRLLLIVVITLIEHWRTSADTMP